ncbi:MAG: glycosyltransferase family 1 protein [Candidatus Margulisiibacteriota bacterium]
MKIAINAMLLMSPRFGIWTYIYNLIEHLARIDAQNNYEIFSGSRVLLLGGSQNFKISNPCCDLPRASARIMWEQFVQPFLINKGSFDVFHSPDHILPFLPIKAKKIVTVHDLCFYKHPETFPLMKRSYKKLVTPGSLRRADRIIADSASTKKDIIDIFAIPADKISVVHIGAGVEFRKIIDAGILLRLKKERGLEKPFLLFVGTLEKRKNIEGLIDAYILAVREHKIDHDLVVVGRKGWLYEGIFKKVQREGLAGKIKFIFDARQEELPGIYNLADLFVYPSVYEGFGLPVLEAMACGTPVITSNVSSLPEVAGDAAILIDPHDTGVLALTIVKVLQDDQLKKCLSQKGVERAKQFGWDKCARQTLEVYKSV